LHPHVRRNISRHSRLLERLYGSGCCSTSLTSTNLHLRQSNATTTPLLSYPKIPPSTPGSNTSTLNIISFVNVYRAMIYAYPTSTPKKTLPISSPNPLTEANSPTSGPSLVLKPP